MSYPQHAEDELLKAKFRKICLDNGVDPDDYEYTPRQPIKRRENRPWHNPEPMIYRQLRQRVAGFVSLTIALMVFYILIISILNCF